MPPTDEDVGPFDNLDNLENRDIPAEEQEVDPFSQIFDFLFKSAYGAELPTFDEILRWKAPGENLAEYMERVKAVLADGSAAILSRGEIPKHFHKMFENLIPAMAWQESCFRQFVVKNKKLTCLLSSNQSSVGIMQVNERVWRGVYDRNRLRWDNHYNALAGCEIADLYLRKYALKHSVWKRGADLDLLSRAVYAMYNGGPGQYKKFLAREQAGKHYQSDLLFLERLQWVGKGKWERLEDCL